MKNPNPFITKCATSMIALLGCLDRVLCTGHLPFQDEASRNRCVDHARRRPRQAFLPCLEGKAAERVAHAKSLAEPHGAPSHYLPGRHRTEDLVQQTIRERRLREGLVGVLCCQETCRTVQLRYGKQRPRLVFTGRPQRVLYFDFRDADFGLIYRRLPTWFPCTVQASVKGHDWLARQRQQQGIGLVQQDNAFTQLDQPEPAQRLAERFPKRPWVKPLHHGARLVNPLLTPPWLRRARSQGVLDQAEDRTDLLFADRAALAGLQPRLLDHAALPFSAPDILTFLGRRWHPRCDGEVLTDCKTDRWPGARLKHRVKNHWRKMDDTFGQILRIETVINNPRQFKGRRRRPRHGRPCLVWGPRNKGVSNFSRYQQVAAAANQRYLAALAGGDDPPPSYRQAEHLAQPKVVPGRSQAGFKPARHAAIHLFQAVLGGAHRLHGFRTADSRRLLQGEAQAPTVRRRQRAAGGRLLQRLHVRGWLAQVPRTRRWRVTEAGQRLLGAVVRRYHDGLATAA